MPLRIRGALEQLDLAIKVYRRYFGTLTAWAALVMGACTLLGGIGVASALPEMLRNPTSPSSLASMSTIFGSIFGAALLGFLGLPLVIGAASCCVAAAVRGQHVQFNQCWEFTKPRYSGMLGQMFLAVFMAFVISFVLMMGVGLIVGLGAIAVASLMNALGNTGIAIGFILLVAVYALFVVMYSALTLWFILVPVVVCMEERSQSGNAVGRAWSLMKGGWGRAAAMMTLLSLGSFLINLMLQLLAMPFLGTSNLFWSGTATAQIISTLGSLITSVLWIPFASLVAALFYFDQRVRLEALDLEWAAYATRENTEETTENAYATSTIYTAPPPNATEQPASTAWSVQPPTIATTPTPFEVPAPSQPAQPTTTGSPLEPVPATTQLLPNEDEPHHVSGFMIPPTRNTPQPGGDANSYESSSPETH